MFREAEVFTLSGEGVHFDRNMQLAKGTANTYLKNIRTLLKYAFDYDYMNKKLDQFLPGIAIKQQERQAKIKPLELEEMEKIFKTCNPQEAALIQFAVYTGLRPGELYALAWEDIDLSNRTVTVERNMEVKKVDNLPCFKLPKYDKVRTIYLNDAALAAVKRMREYTQATPKLTIKIYPQSSNRKTEYTKCMVCPVFVRPDHRNDRHLPPEQRWLSHKSWRLSWITILRRADVSYRCPRQTRHTFACWSLSSNVELTDLRDHLGHVSVETLEKHYAKWIEAAKPKQAQRTNNKLAESGFLAAACM